MYTLLTFHLVRTQLDALTVLTRLQDSSWITIGCAIPLLKMADLELFFTYRLLCK